MPVDDAWKVEAIEGDPKHVRLHNIRTGHFFVLGGDNCREFREPDFFLLRCKVYILPAEIFIEPINPGSEKGEAPSK